MPNNPLRPRPGESLVPAPVRAALGLVVSVVDDRQKLADRALELPVLAVSTALQVSLRAQQRYAAFTARGDDFLNQLRGAPELPPDWARFDDDDAAQPAESEPVAAVADLPKRRAAPKKAAPRKSAGADNARAGQASAFDRVSDSRDEDLPELHGFAIPTPPED